MQEKSLAILGIIIAILGVFVPIGWDYFHSRSLVQIQVLSASQIVNKADNKIEVTYDGKPVNSVSKLEFLIINNGNKPITDDQIKVPLSVTLASEATLLDAKMKNSEPKDVVASLTTVGNTINIKSPLLNPNDRIYFSALISGNIPKLTPGGRISGIKSVELWDRTAEKTNPREIPGSFYVLLFSLLMPFALFRQALKERRDARTVIDSWENYSVMSVKDFLEKTKTSCATIYTRDKAFESLKPLYKKLEQNASEIDEAIYTEAKSIINHNAERAWRANTVLAAFIIVLIVAATGYLISILMKVYG